MSEIELLRREVAALVSNLSPFIGQEEMQARYGVTSKTLLAMERRKEIPTRVRGRWLRSEVLDWEAAR
jgi:predicted DNA-binding transcriptional regulator AlpA